MHIAADILVHVISAEAAVRAACRQALRDLAVETLAFADVAAFADGALQRIPDCLLLDLDLPDGADELLRRAREADYRIPVICMADHADVALVVRAMKAGAVDFLGLPVAATELVHAVSAAIDVGNRWRKEDGRRSRARSLVGRLTPREHAVFDLVLDGLLNKQIASRLGSTEATVKVHRSRLMRKLEVGSIVELIQLGLEADRAPPAPSVVAAFDDRPVRPPDQGPPGRNALVAPGSGARYAAASSTGRATVSVLVRRDASGMSAPHPADLTPLPTRALELASVFGGRPRRRRTIEQAKSHAAGESP
jgi:FixJ family two-component response regulator